MKKRLLAAGLILTLFTGSAAAAEENQFESAKVKKGETLTIGSYEQDNDEETAAADEPIEWIVLKKDEDRALLITKYAIDGQPFYDWQSGMRPYPETLTWENSDIRTWLNGTFLQTAFTDSERSRIEETQLTSKKNSYYSEHTDGGEDTADRIFLLSEDEAFEYFDGRSDRQAEPTDFAAKRSAKKDEDEEETEEKSDNGAPPADQAGLPADAQPGAVTMHYEVFVSEESDGCFWWLRTPGKPTKKSGEDGEKDTYTQSNIMCVGAEGSVVIAGFPGARTDFGVRPAMWIKLDS